MPAARLGFFSGGAAAAEGRGECFNIWTSHAVGQPGGGGSRCASSSSFLLSSSSSCSRRSGSGLQDGGIRGDSCSSSSRTSCGGVSEAAESEASSTPPPAAHSSSISDKNGIGGSGHSYCAAAAARTAACSSRRTISLSFSNRSNAVSSPRSSSSRTNDSSDTSTSHVSSDTTTVNSSSSGSVFLEASSPRVFCCPSSSGRRGLCCFALSSSSSRIGGGSGCKRGQKCSNAVGAFLSVCFPTSSSCCYVARRNLSFQLHHNNSSRWSLSLVSAVAHATARWLPQHVPPGAAAAHAFAKGYCSTAQRTAASHRASSSCLSFAVESSAAMDGKPRSRPLMQEQQHLLLGRCRTSSISRCDGDLSSSCSWLSSGNSCYNRGSSSSISGGMTGSGSRNRYCRGLLDSNTSKGDKEGQRSSCGETWSSSNSSSSELVNHSRLCSDFIDRCCRMTNSSSGSSSAPPNSSSRGTVLPSYCSRSQTRANSSDNPFSSSGDKRISCSCCSSNLTPTVTNIRRQHWDSSESFSSTSSSSCLSDIVTGTASCRSNSSCLHDVTGTASCSSDNRKACRTGDLLYVRSSRLFFGSSSSAPPKSSSCSASNSSTLEEDTAAGCSEIMESAAGERWIDSSAVSVHLVRAVGLEYLRAMLSSRGVPLQQQQEELPGKKQRKQKQQQRQGLHALQQQQRLEEKKREREQRRAEEQQVFDALWRHVSPQEKPQQDQQQQKKKKEQLQVSAGAAAADKRKQSEAADTARERSRSSAAGVGGRQEPTERAAAAAATAAAAPAAAAPAAAEGGVPSGSGWPVHARHLCMFFKGCMRVRLRELEVLDALSEILAVLLEAPRVPEIDVLVELADACTALRLWRPQLFEVVAQCLLRSLRAAAADAADYPAAAGVPDRSVGRCSREDTSAAAHTEEGRGGGEAAPSQGALGGAESRAAAAEMLLQPYQVVVLLEAFSYQRLRHAELLQLLEASSFGRLRLFSPRLCCRLLHALALLRRPPHPPQQFAALLQRLTAADPLAAAAAAKQAGVATDLPEAAATAAAAPEQGGEEEEAAATALPGVRGRAARSVKPLLLQHEKQQQQMPKETCAALRLADMAKVAHALFLLELEVQQRDLLLRLCCCMVPLIMEHPPTFWRSSPSAVNLHQQLLLLHSALRYIRREQIYEQLPPAARNAFRRLQRVELKRNPRPPTNFVVRMSELLTKLRIAHFCYVTRGALVFDILERDKRLYWQCNTADRFYARSGEKTTTVRLQERIAKGMGLRVASCEYWQWQKMKRRRTRLEYLRMQRYYALKDRRRFDEDFEGWMLPLVHHMHRRCRLHYPHYFPNYVPLSRVEY